ncbi:acyl-CoA N-acyltransferase [Hyaloscypha variabilis F]|uniref:Acyl-CoA N-acyltransferase n=1 Tax=Hyaloscypha variabilis (strain UAMH 11265 / GT02V1 / F) TaxID=1149755 RepID=A0A2J6RKV0_HYAVF|nr:acyl-CoA N-acyltransferase [Hyaloscypha variabilis F]
MAESLNMALSQSIKLDIPGGEYFLTTFEEHDAEAMHEVLAIDSVSDRLIRIPKPYTLEDAKSWLSSNLASQKELLAIPTVSERHAAFFKQGNSIPVKAIRHKDKFIGSISLAPHSTETVVEMGYYLHPDHQGKRIMREAGKKLLRYAANEFGIRKVFCSADDGNPLSAKVIRGVLKDTAVGDVETGRKILVWPVGKRVEGESWSSTWLWNIEPEEGYEF